MAPPSPKARVPLCLYPFWIEAQGDFFMANKELQPVPTLENNHATIEVPSAVDFVYIMREDTDFVVHQLATATERDYGIGFAMGKEVIQEAYEDFIKSLAEHLGNAFGPKGETEVHLYEAGQLEEAIRQKAGILPIVSLDPLLEKDVFSFRVSRGFYRGGTEDFGQVNRPGSTPLADQAGKLAQVLGDCPVCVAEDDIFSGGSVISALEHLQNAGIKIAKLIPGFQIGKPTKIEAMGIFVDPVITYKTTDGVDIFSKVDLGDPRDYLMGASGLVIKLSDGSFGRAPYLLPFVSTSARASVPEENEQSVAHHIWQANGIFFHTLEELFGKPMVLAHMDPYFQSYMIVEHDFDANIGMKELIQWADEHVR